MRTRSTHKIIIIYNKTKFRLCQYNENVKLYIILPLQECRTRTLNAISPLPFGHSPIAQTYASSIQNLSSFARGEVGTRIDRDNSLIMPLRFVRQAWPTTRRSRLYYAHKGSRTAKTSELVLVYQRWKRSFLPCGKRSTKSQGEQLQLVVVEAKGACVRRKLGAPMLAAVAARVTVTKITAHKKINK